MKPSSYTSAGPQSGNLDPEDLDAVFSALSNPTRRAILARLARGEATVMELAEPFDMTQPAVSRHLKVLERAGLISRSRDAQRRPCRLEAEPMAEAVAWLEGYRTFWEGRFRELDTLLDELQESDPAPSSPALPPQSKGRRR
jgi:DNA-binding transcriptional ArsR family regulator